MCENTNKSSGNEDFNKFFKLLILCVTARNARPVRGNQKTAAFFILLTIYFVIFICLVTNNFLNTVLDPNISVIKKIFNSLMITGLVQIVLKNFGGTYWHKKFIILVDWIERLHTAQSDKKFIQTIIDFELRRVIRISMIFFKIYLLLFYLSMITSCISLIWNNLVMCRIPEFPILDEYPFMYHVYQSWTFFVSTIWHCFADSAIIFIGLYMVAYVRILNKMIKCVNVTIAECPDLLMRIMRNHVEMIRILDIFNNSVNFMSFIQIIMSTLMFLAMLFGLQTYREVFSMYFMFASVLSQFFLLCLFGELIKSQTEKISWNLYLSDWYDLTRNDKKIIYTMMMMSQKEIGLKAAGMYEVSLMSFVHVLKLSLSFSAIFLTLT
ncbi:hypothetical protein DMENIID0001_014910 [Sergentomyia squamirostris]